MTPVSRWSDLTPAVLIVVAFALLSTAWAGGNPVGGTPDEPAHFIKAYATLDGQINGERPNVDLSGHRPRSAAWFAISGRSYWIPGRMVPPPTVICYAFDANSTPDCQNMASALSDRDAEVLAFTHLGTYSPFPYLLTGPAMRGADDFLSAVWRGRLASVAVCTMFIAWAAALACRRGAVALLGLVLAVTPGVVFLAGSLNTSGLEIASAVCFWCALLGVAREREPGTAVWGAVAVAGMGLALTRPLGAMMVPVAVATVIMFTRAAPLWAKLRSATWPAHAAVATVIVACAVSFLWAQFAIPHPHIDFGLAASSLGPALRDLPNQTRDVIGIFGWNNTTMPNAAYLLGLILLAGLGAFALALGSARDRLVLVGLGLAIVALNLALAVFVEAQIGFGMQARYIMPLAVGLPVLAADVVQQHAGRFKSMTVRRLLRAAYGGVAVLQFTAFVTNQHRHAVGLHGAWLPPWDSKWSPEWGLGVWLALATTGCVALVIGGFGSRAVVPSASS
jgi:hypothetical protein